MTDDRPRAVLSIGAAAAALGVHPQTLRDYERLGLLTPQRTPGGTRRFGEAELRRVARIQGLTREGITLTGVRLVLALEDELRRANERIAQLEASLPQHARHASDHRPPAPSTQLVRTSSLSVELVHIPRPPRSPRWRNQ